MDVNIEKSVILKLDEWEAETLADILFSINSDGFDDTTVEALALEVHDKIKESLK